MMCNGILYMSGALLLCAATGCATDIAAERNDGDWGANGYYADGPVGDAEFIGIYKTKTACERASKEWMATQTVGAPVFAECLPIDRR